MTSEPCKIEKQLCRCCHAEGLSFFMMNMSYYNSNGEPEVYSDLLRDCLKIEILPVEGEMCEPTFRICNTCINQLRGAWAFKKQVLMCEKKFSDMYAKNILGNPTEFEVKVVFDAVKKEFELDFGDGVSDAEPHSDPHDDVDVLENNFSDDEDVKPSTSTLEEAAARLKAKSFVIVNTKTGQIGRRNIINKKTGEIARKSTRKKAAGTSDTNNVKKKKVPATSLKRDQKVVVRKAAKPARKKYKKKKLENPTDGDDVENKDKKPENPTDDDVEKKDKKGIRTIFALAPTDFKQEGDIYYCAHCPKTKQSKELLREHVRIVHYKRYICSECGLKIPTKVQLKNHKFEAHNIDVRHKCNACTQTFNTAFQLRNHITVYHMLGEKCCCQSCDYETYSLPGLLKHNVKHTKEKNYLCKYCNKSFLRKTTLQFHERIHTGDRRKVCAVCKQAFVQKASLNYHMAKYHPGVKF